MTPGESIAKFIFTSLFRTYNIREGKELALICRDKNNRNNNMIAWQRKVSPVPGKMLENFAII